MAMPIRYDISFSGRVQGVGFRYTTCRVAERLDVAGWVRNEPDGTVRCVAEGAADELERFVAGVKEAMKGCVNDARIQTQGATGEFSSFLVHYA